MEDSVDIGELRHRELYQHFSEDELKQFAAVMAVREYDDGQVIYEVGEDTPGEKRALLVILSGEVLLSTEAGGKEPGCRGPHHEGGRVDRIGELHQWRKT